MRIALTVIAALFAAAYAFALFIFAVGHWGWFGADRDPLSGIYLAPLGLPWNIVTQWLPDDGSRLWVALLAPAVTLAILTLLTLAARRRVS